MQAPQSRAQTWASAPACNSTWAWSSLRRASSGLLSSCSLRNTACLRPAPPPWRAAGSGGARSFAATSKLRPVFRGGKMKVAYLFPMLCQLRAQLIVLLRPMRVCTADSPRLKCRLCSARPCFQPERAPACCARERPPGRLRRACGFRRTAGVQPLQGALQADGHRQGALLPPGPPAQALVQDGQAAAYAPQERGPAQHVCDHHEEAGLQDDHLLARAPGLGWL